MRPHPDQPTLLVYVECREGCWGASGEGAPWPRCGTHNLPMLAPVDPFHRHMRLGFVATLMHEQQAISVIASKHPSRPAFEPHRYYSPLWLPDLAIEIQRLHPGIVEVATVGPQRPWLARWTERHWLAIIATTTILAAAALGVAVVRLAT